MVVLTTKNSSHMTEYADRLTTLVQARSSNLIGETNSLSVMLASADLRVQQAKKMTIQTEESRQVAK
jgi:hypothetical protein